MKNEHDDDIAVLGATLLASVAFGVWQESLSASIFLFSMVLIVDHWTRARKR